MHKKHFQTHVIVFVNRAHLSDRHEDLLEIPIRAHISFGKRREYLLYLIEMANFCQSGFGEAFFANCHDLDTFGCGRIEFLQVRFQVSLKTGILLEGILKSGGPRRSRRLFLKGSRGWNLRRRRTRPLVLKKSIWITAAWRPLPIDGGASP